MQKNALKNMDILIGTYHDNIHLGEDLLITDRIEETSLSACPRVISEHYVIVICRGELCLDSGEEREAFHANDLVYLPPDTPVVRISGSGLEAYFVSMSTTFVQYLNVDFGQQISHLMDGRPFFRMTMEEDSRVSLRPYLTIMQNSFNDWDRLRNSEILLNMSSFMCRIIGLGYRYTGREVLAGPTTAQSTYRKFKDLLFSNYKIHHGLGFYAHELCLSPRHLSTTVRKASGMTAKQWIDRMVVREAVSLLQRPDLSVKQVASELNFPSQTAFGKYIKVHTGHSPLFFKNGPDQLVTLIYPNDIT